MARILRKTYSLSLPSCPRSISKVEAYAHKLSAQFEIKQEVFPNMLISLTEAVNNAIKHGNCEDETKKVFITSRCIQNRKLLLIVSDQGNGFNPNKLADPTDIENIDCCGGRGVFLIKQLCDDVKFLDNGSTIEMHFNL